LADLLSAIGPACIFSGKSRAITDLVARPARLAKSPLDPGAALRSHPAIRTFASAPGGIAIINPAGRILGRIETGTAIANCTFGAADGRTLYMTPITCSPGSEPAPPALVIDHLGGTP
jgi:hypothetical protein